MNFMLVLEIALGIVLGAIVITIITLLLYKPFVRFYTKKTMDVTNEILKELESK